MSTTSNSGRIDLPKFRASMKEQQDEARGQPPGPNMFLQARISLVEDQLKEARIGEFTIQCDEATRRRGGGKAPSPLQYFIAAIGF